MLTRKIYPPTIVFGCDPEFFFTKDGQIIGAEKVLPKEGLQYDPEKDKTKRDGDYTSKGESPTSNIIIDGIQAELNPRPNTCRANLGNEISACFRKLSTTLGEQTQIDFSANVSITEEEMATLSEASKKFGCAPSKNTYRKRNTISIKDASTFYQRSAGGHLHLGDVNNPIIRTSTKKALLSPEKLVPILDIIVGNTCVLIDRNPGNAERRKVYGKAGEYRTPKHGLEYRTLSNFWLQSYQLFSLVTNLARFSVAIVEASIAGPEDPAGELLKATKRARIKRAINNNDFDLAMQNFMAIKDILLTITPDTGDTPITSKTFDAFLYFIEKGVNHWFKEDPYKHWINLPEGHDTGWETFLRRTVTQEMLTKKTT